MDKIPTIVCLCGSPRFFDAFEKANLQETLKGNIVLTVGFMMHKEGMKHGGDVGITPEQKKSLDDLHLRKIDLADEVLLLNVGDYLGASTRREAYYAAMQGKHIRLWEEPSQFDLTRIKTFFASWEDWEHARHSASIPVPQRSEG